MKAAALLLLSLCFNLGVNAINLTTQKDSIWYSVDNTAKTATVIAIPADKNPDGLFTYHGDVVIPSVLSLTAGEYNVTGIAAGAFKNCTAVTSVSIPEGVTTIGDSAFYNTGLTAAKIPDSATGWVGRYAFAHCQKLKSIDTGDGQTFNTNNSTYKSYPGLHLCEGDSTLTDVRIGTGVLRVPTNSFVACVSLKSFHIPSNVANVNSGVFGTSSSAFWTLDSLVVDDSETAITGSKWNSNVLQRVHVTNIYLGRNVNNFRTPSVYMWKSLTIGPKVTSISKYLSTSRTENTLTLSKVQTLNTDPSACPGTFSDKIYGQAVLVVPDGTLAAYKADANWGKFATIVEATEYATGIKGVKATNENATETARYSIGGQAVGKQHKGLSIVRMSDGSVRKVIVK